jgi:hypothetical protein
MTRAKVAEGVTFFRPGGICGRAELGGFDISSVVFAGSGLINAAVGLPSSA